MKKKRIKVTALVLTMLMAVGVLSGCGMESTNEIKTKDKSIKSTLSIYYTEEELNALFAESGESMTVDQLTEEDLAEMELVKTERDGKIYYVQSESDTVKGTNKLKEECIILDSNKFVKYSNVTDSSINEELGLDEDMELDFYSSIYKFDKPIKTSNLEVDKVDNKMITVTDSTKESVPVLYATFTDKAAKCKSIKSNISKKYTNKKKVQFTSDGVITKYTVNGKKYTPTIYVTYDSKDNPILQKDYYEFKKANTTYKIKVTLSSGYTKTFTYVYDNVKPKINVTNNKKYKTSKKVTVTEKNLSYIKLDGKKIKNNTVVKKKGKHTLTAVDKAGNTKTVKFTIYK